ncbi:solute carrier family member 5 [Stylonychia lemnae]|uniref:Solute carrier family member 5 n=1 Tax=Stylonychia lemnae TaxID=5949 RepID=A0A078BBZ1_STYLE|nr:solute carrier family member 5 [Stylonychia lemnae]|eukprot:CDW90772.1 solute carrier family member 5 [Stylonychia lemnae]
MNYSKFRDLGENAKSSQSNQEQELQNLHPTNQDNPNDSREGQEIDEVEPINLMKADSYRQIVDMDQALELCGGFGKFQLIGSTFLMMAMVSSAFFLYSFAFLEHKPQYQCLNQETQIWETCLSLQFCNNPDVQWRINFEDGESIHNLIEQLNFHCEPDYKLGLFGSFFLLGIVVGCFTLARAGDIYGRRRIFIIGMVSQIIVCTTILFSTSIYFDYVLLFLIGWAITGKQFVGFSYLIELQPVKQQVIMGTAMFMLEAVAYLFICAYFSYISKYWQYIQIPTIGFAVFGVIVVYFFPESPRFLLSQNRFTDLRDTLNTIARINGKNPKTANDFQFKEEQTQKNLLNQKFTNNPDFNDEPISSSHSLKELCLDKTLRNNLIFSCIIWSCSMFNFYLITFYLKYFPGSIFSNSKWFAVSDFISFLISGNILKRTNPQKTLFCSYLFSGLGSLTYLLFYWDVRLVPLFILMSRIGNSMAFNTVYVSNNRLFPTKFMTSTYGIVNFVSHLYAIGAPLMAEISDPYPFTAFLLHSCIGAICSFFLKEINKEQKQPEAVMIH